MILDKLETKINYSGDEFQSEKIVSTASKGLSPVDDISHENVEIRSEITHESGHTVDSQETISGNKMHSELYENETPENFDCDELQRPSTNFIWNLASRMCIPHFSMFFVISRVRCLFLRFECFQQSRDF